MYHHKKKYITGGRAIELANSVLVMLHGRGGDASQMLSLADELHIQGMTVIAPQAYQNSWYPHSFMAPDSYNQPALDSALKMVGEVIDDILSAGISAERIYILGFSQGACLTLEYLSRNARRYGGAVAFTGGLIGEELKLGQYHGDFEGTPLLVTSGDADPHVPLSRVKESVKQLRAQNAHVKLQVYTSRPHTIITNEIILANEWIFSTVENPKDLTSHRQRHENI